MPRFTAFNREGLFGTATELADGAGYLGTETPFHRSLASLIAMPVVVMIDGNGMRLEATQATNLRWWQTLDRTPLEPYWPPW